MDSQQCDMCLYQAEDIETGESYCTINMDQDDLARLLGGSRQRCQYFKMGDDYSIVKKQAF